MRYHNRISANRRFFLLVAIACISWCISGLVSAVPGVRGAAMLSFDFLAVLAYFMMPRYRDISFRNTLILYCLTVVSMFLYERLTGYTSETVNWFSFVYPFCFLLIGKCLVDNRIGKGALLSFLIVDILAKIAVTMSLYSSNRAIMKEATIGYERTSGPLHMVIQYGFMYLVPVIALLTLMIVLQRQRQNKRNTSWLAFFCILCVLLVLSQITMLILLTPGLLLVYYVYQRQGRISKVIIIVTCLGILLLINLDTIINGMYNLNIFGDAVKLRLLGISKVLEGGSAYINSTFTGNMAEGDTVVNRIGSYWMSVTACIHNFWLGYATRDYMIPGGHSTWIDFVAHYGIGVSIPIYATFISGYRWVKRKYSAFRIEIDMVFAYLCIIGFLGNISITNCCLCLFVFVPLFINYLQRNSKEISE